MRSHILGHNILLAGVRVVWVLSICVVLIGLVSVSANDSRQYSSVRLGVSDKGLITPAGNTITVNSILDVANSTDGLCTLREAIVAANSNLASGAVAGECVGGDIGASPDTINFTVSGTINLAAVLPELTSDMSISGPGSGQLTVRRSTGGDYRIFFADHRGVNISGMTITNGKTPDGAPGSASGEAGERGGAILQIAGVMTLADVVITGNRTGNGGASAGGSGTVGGNGGSGGGIWASGTLTMSNCVVSNNITGVGGSGNTKGASGLGGGVMIASDGQATLADSTVNNNRTGSDPGTVGRAGNGGGILNFGNLTVLRSTINGNVTGDNDPNASSSTSGGGIDSGGTLTLINSTISGNRTGVGANQIGSGGVSSTTTMVIINCTITGNAHFSGNFGNGVYGSIHAFVRNSLIAGNGNAGEPDVIGTFTSQGHNLIGKAFGNVGFMNGVNGDQVGTLAVPINPLLGPLANNGGLTLTHALNAGSPALDAGDDCVTQAAHCGDANTPQFLTDQRGLGFDRRVDGPDADSTATVDIGSWEAQVSNPTNTSVTSSVNPSDFGENVTFMATVTSNTGIPSGSVQFKDNGMHLGSPVPLNSSGLALFATDALPAGTHTITGEYSGSMEYGASTGTLSGGQVVRARPALTIDDPSTFEGNSGTKLLNFTVSLLQPSHLTVNVNFATATGTADLTDFVGTNGTLTFTPGQLSKVVSVTINGDINFEPNETLTVNLSTPVNATISKSVGSGTILNDDAQGGFASFDNTNYNVSEGGSVNIKVNRTNDVSRSVTIDYVTNDTGAPSSCSASNGLASSRCDFVTAVGTLTFAPGETLKTFTILANRDSYTEGAETFTVNLLNPTGGAVIVSPSQTFIRITDDATGLPPNAIDDARNFVRQHYLDFLNREPDASGWDFWTNQITSCGNNAQCIEVRRVDVSVSFFLSIEFQQSGYLVERFYKTGYGDAMGSSTFVSNHLLNVPMVRFNEFLEDTQRIGQGVIVLQPGWELALENNKQAYAREFVQTTRFTTALPTTLTPAQFVERLDQNTGGVLSLSERASVINLFGNAADTANVNARAQAVRQVADDTDLINNEFNRAFVLAQYFGYLRRNPNDSPDSDYTGYDFWLSKLNQFNGNYIDAEMVKAFLSSIEYRQRFGP